MDSIFLISPLSMQDCISRLEAASESKAVSDRNESGSLRCHVSGRSFTLRKSYPRFVAYLRGELSESSRGTVIDCSVEVENAANALNSVWLMAVLPLFACVALGLLLNGFLNGFSKELFLIILVIVAIPALLFLRRQLGIRKAERDRNEMLDFLQNNLEAKPRSL
jgi:hypothetical protein